MHGQWNSRHRKFQNFCVLFCSNCLLNSRKGLRSNPLSISSAGFHNICFNLYSDFTFRCLPLLNTDTSPHAGSHSLRCRMLLTVSSDTGRMGPCPLVTTGGDMCQCSPGRGVPGTGCGTTGSVQDTCTGHLYRHPTCTHCTPATLVQWSSWCHDHPPPAPPPRQI